MDVADCLPRAVAPFFAISGLNYNRTSKPPSAAGVWKKEKTSASTSDDSSAALRQGYGTSVDPYVSSSSSAPLAPTAPSS